MITSTEYIFFCLFDAAVLMLQYISRFALSHCLAVCLMFLSFLFSHSQALHSLLSLCEIIRIMKSTPSGTE